MHTSFSFHNQLKLNDFSVIPAKAGIQSLPDEPYG